MTANRQNRKRKNITDTHRRPGVSRQDRRFAGAARRASTFSRRGVARHGKARRSPRPPAIAESITPLWTETDARGRFLVAGKIHNLRLAAARLDGVEIPAGEIFSFWKHVGRTSRLKGYVARPRAARGLHHPEHRRRSLPDLERALRRRAPGRFRDRRAPRPHAGHRRLARRTRTRRDRVLELCRSAVPLRPGRSGSRRSLMTGEPHRPVSREQGPADNKLHAIHRTVRTSDATRIRARRASTDDCHRVIKPAATIASSDRQAFLVDEYSPEFDRYVSACDRSRRPA